MTFAVQLQALIDKARGDADRAVRQTVVLAIQSLIHRSPVDTGRFRANWSVGVGSVDGSVSSQTDLSQDGRQTATKLAEEMLSKEGAVFYITNSLPYAKALEYGHSQQSPYGMVRLTITVLPTLIKDYIEATR